MAHEACRYVYCPVWLLATFSLLSPGLGVVFAVVQGFVLLCRSELPSRVGRVCLGAEMYQASVLSPMVTASGNGCPKHGALAFASFPRSAACLRTYDQGCEEIRLRHR